MALSSKAPGSYLHQLRTIRETKTLDSSVNRNNANAPLTRRQDATHAANGNLRARDGVQFPNNGRGAKALREHEARADARAGKTSTVSPSGQHTTADKKTGGADRSAAARKAWATRRGG